VLRVTAFLISLGLIALWLLFLRMAFTTGPDGIPIPRGTPAPGAFLVTAIFGGVALAGGIAALRDVPVGVAITGGISLFPVGLYLTLFPVPTRLIGVLDAALLVIGIVLMRTERISPPEGPE
jgi:hypothetical protein